MTAAARIRGGLLVTAMGAAAVWGGAAVDAAGAHAVPVSVTVGHPLVTAVPGFAPGAAVQLRLDRVIPAGTVRADRWGTAHVRIRVPRSLGAHRLFLVGPLPGSRHRSTAITGRARSDPQGLLAVVPKLVTVAFRVVASLGVAGESEDRRDHGAASAGRRDLADTGFAPQLPVLLGSALVVLGAAVAASARRTGESGPTAARGAE